MLGNRKVVPASPPLSNAAGVVKGIVAVAPPKVEIPQIGVLEEETFAETAVVDEMEILPEVPTIPLESVDEIPDATVSPVVRAKSLADEDDMSFLENPNLNNVVYGKYRRMLKCGLPAGAVLHKMNQDGIPVPSKVMALSNVVVESQGPGNGEKMPQNGNHAGHVIQEIDEKTDGATRGGTPSQSCSTKTEIEHGSDEFLGGSELQGDRFDKYRKMMKCGLPQGAVEQKMKQDGVDPNSYAKSKSGSKGIQSGLLGTVTKTETSQPVIATENPSGETCRPLPHGEMDPVVRKELASLPSPQNQIGQLPAAPTLIAVSNVKDTLVQGNNETNNDKSWPSTDLRLSEAAVKPDLDKLLTILTKRTGSIPFGDLCSEYGTGGEKVVNILVKAKKRYLVEYKGEMLFRGKDDKVVINVDVENAQRFARGEPAIPRQRAPLNESMVKAHRKEEIKPVLVSSSRPAALLAVTSVVEVALGNKAAFDKFEALDSSSKPEAEPMTEPSKDEIKASPPNKNEASAGPVNGNDIEITPTQVVTSLPFLAPSTTTTTTTDGDDSNKTVPQSSIQAVESVDPSSTTPPKMEEEIVSAKGDDINENDDANVTGRGPPPQPPSSPEQKDRERSPSRSPNRRHTGSVINKTRSPSKVLPQQESMFDIFGRRRSSGTVYRVALNLMDSKVVATIPRDAITDALSWTVGETDQKDIFSFENSQGLEMAKVMEKLAYSSTSPSKRRLGERSESFVVRERMRNQTQAALLLQRVMRGWITRLKYRSCLWVRDRLNSAVKSRMSEKVEEALAASRAIAAKFVKPPEHERAVASLDTIREERALKAKIQELSELSVDARDLTKRFASVIERMARCRASDPFAFKDEVSLKAELIYDAALKRAEISMRLHQACSSKCAKEMMESLRECDLAAAKFIGLWEEKFLDEEKKKVRTILVAIQHEEPAIVGLLKECVSQDVVKANPAMIFNRTNFEDLENAIAKAVDELGINPITPGALQILSLGSAVLSLRKSLVAQIGLKTPSWNSCEKLLGDARLKLQVWQSAVGESKSMEYCETWVSAIHQELDLISAELDRKAGVHDIIEALNDSVARCDVDDIRNVLRKGMKRGLQDRDHDIGLQDTLTKAGEYVERFSLIHARLSEVLAGINRSPAELKKVANDARSIVLPNSTDARLVDECDRLCMFAETELLPLISETLVTVPDRKELEKVVEKVRKTERMGGMPELVSVEHLLGMDDMRLVQEQLRAATHAHNEKRKTDLTIRFRELHLEQNPSQFKFHNFSDLKDPKDWSSEASSRRLFSGRRETRASRMLYSSKNPIQAPLTKAPDSDVKLRRFAIKANRTILAYAGDLEVDDLTEFGGDVCQGLHELLVFALGEHQVRDEVYCQIMKHLTENRRPGSVTRTWNIFAMCLITFPPSTCLDMFVESFIRTNAPAAEMSSLLDQLHCAVFAGERPTAPTLGDIKARQDDGGLIEGLGRRSLSSQ